MNIIVAIIVMSIVLIILTNLKIDKTSIQLMLLGLELTVIGAVLVLVVIFTKSNSLTYIYILGVALMIIGLITNLYGFSKKYI